MKVIAILVLGVCAAAVVARESPKFDEYYTIIGIKAENKRLDNYAIQLKNSPNSRGVVLIYAQDERTVKRAQARARRAVKYLVQTRGVDPTKVKWRYEAACGHETITLYILYPDLADPQRDLKCLR